MRNVAVLLVAVLFAAPAYGEHHASGYDWNAANGGYEVLSNWTQSGNDSGPAYGSGVTIQNGGISTAAVYYEDGGDPIGAYALYIGHANGSGTLNLQLPTDPDPMTDDDSFCVKRTMLGGYSNAGTINHSSGTYFAKRAMFIGGSSKYGLVGVGTYNLSGTGILEQSTYWAHASDPPTLNIGSTAGSTGILTQSGTSTINIFRDAEAHGIVAPDGNLYIGESGTGTYDINGGTLVTDTVTVDLDVATNSGTWNINNAGASIEVRKGLTLGGNSILTNNNCKLTAVTGTQIHMVGVKEKVFVVSAYEYVFNNVADFENRSLDASNATGLGGLNNVTLVFEGGHDASAPNTVAGMEVAGKDIGTSRAGLGENFALEGLTLGGAAIGYVRLADSNDNQADGLAESLYVQNLVIGAGSTLDLNGLNLYYYKSVINGTVLTGGGALVQIDLLAGDANKDVNVDDADLSILLSNFGDSGAWGAGNFNGDGNIDDADLSILLANFGKDASTSTVPEPATLTLLGLGVLAMIRRRRQQK